MAGITRMGMDSSGGALITGSQNVFVNGAGAVRIGDVVAGHGDSPHTTNQMVTGSSTVFVNGIPVCRQGDVAACGHAASGSSNVSAG